MVPERIKVVCLAVGDLSPEYVTKLESMLRRHMPVAFDLICATDRPGGFPASVETIDVGGWPAVRKGMRPTVLKLNLFDPARVPFPEFLYLDTSLVIRKDMTHLLEFAYGQPHELVAVQDWHYDAYNTSVMRIRHGGALEAIPEAYGAGTRFVQKVPGDQDFVTSMIWTRGWEDRVTTFPKEMVVNYGSARTAAKRGLAAGRRMLEEATIVKFNGCPKMHELLSPRYRLRQAVTKRNPFHRNAWFWVRELRELWR